jgi:hypothetical protein
MPGSDVERRDGDDALPVHVAITDGAVDWTFAQGTDASASVAPLRARARHTRPSSSWDARQRYFPGSESLQGKHQRYALRAARGSSRFQSPGSGTSRAPVFCVRLGAHRLRPSVACGFVPNEGRADAPPHGRRSACAVRSNATSEARGWDPRIKGSDTLKPGQPEIPCSICVSSWSPEEPLRAASTIRLSAPNWPAAMARGQTLAPYLRAAIEFPISSRMASPQTVGSLGGNARARGSAPVYATISAGAHHHRYGWQLPCSTDRSG